jgi:photosystem II stability/assembly factor-like uncharacterized protein
VICEHGAPPDFNLANLHALSDALRGSLWTAGAEGTIIYSADNGQTWEDLSLHEDETLSDVSFLDGKNGWVVGEFGVIKHTTDGGHTWVESDKVVGLP